MDTTVPGVSGIFLISWTALVWQEYCFAFQQNFGYAMLHSTCHKWSPKLKQACKDVGLNYGWCFTYFVEGKLWNFWHVFRDQNENSDWKVIQNIQKIWQVIHLLEINTLLFWTESVNLKSFSLRLRVILLELCDLRLWRTLIMFILMAPMHYFELVIFSVKPSRILNFKAQKFWTEKTIEKNR